MTGKRTIRFGEVYRSIIDHDDLVVERGIRSRIHYYWNLKNLKSVESAVEHPGRHAILQYVFLPSVN